MKKRILSFMVALSMLLPIISVTAFSAEDIKSDKQYMEQYIRNLTDGGDYMKYTNHPFDEYNNLVSKKVYNDDFDGLVALGDTLNNAGSMLSWAIKNGFGNTDSYTEAKYEALCAEWLTKVTNKSVNEELADNVGNLDELEGKNRKLDEIIIRFADVMSKKTETSTAYKRLHESFLGDIELIDAIGESKFIEGFPVITSLFSVLIRDYEENEKYLNIMKNTVYEIALSHEELANTITDKEQSENMKKEAQAMRNAVDRVVQKYKDRSSGAFNELTDLIIQYGTEEKFDELKTIIGKETFKSVFKLFDLTNFGIELFMNISGLGDIAKSSANTIFMFPITLNMQNKFFEEGKSCLLDGDFSDEDYEHMNILFDLCRAAQEINCEYADVTFDKNNKTNEQIIQEYVNYAKGKFDIDENANEIDGIFENHAYKVITTPMDYTEAKKYCESVEGYLAVINSDEERNYLGNILNSIDYRTNKFLVECTPDVSSATHVLMQMGNFASNISSLIPDGKYKEYSEYKEKDGYYFICEWDYYDKTKQSEKKLLRDKGQCGDNAFWKLTIYGEMIVYGSGPMYNSILTNEDFERIESQGYSYKHIISSRYKDETKKVIVEDGITSIGYSAFGWCDELIEATLPDTLISIGVNSFNGCKKLKQVNIPKELKYIGREAFANCEQLGNIDLSLSILKIGTGAFRRCFLLENIAVPNGVDYIGKQAFASCRNLKSATLSNNITRVHGRLFNDCTSLYYVNIPVGVTDIETYAFGNCEKLTSIIIPDTVKRIESGAFSGTSVNILIIPKNVESIGSSAFDYCPLEKLYILNPNCTIGAPGFWDAYITAKNIVINVYGYEGSTAQRWVNDRVQTADISDKKCMYEFHAITDTTIVPSTPGAESDLSIENDLSRNETSISNSEYLKSQEYLKALQIGTDAAMEEYIYNYESGDINPNIKTYANTDEYLLDIYSDETFNLNFKTAYLNENSTMQAYKNKNHYILILPDNAQNLNEGYHYLVEGDGTGFKYNALPSGNYTAYIRSDLCTEVSGDLAQFKITVHDLAMDNIDEELSIAINFLKENGAMTGYEDGSFRPNKSMTRAEFAAIICRFTNNDIEFTGENNAFSDVFGDYWGYDYVMNAYQKGLLKGYGGGVFGCDDTLTEEQAVTVLCRMLGDTYEDVSYIETSVDEKGGYSEGYISIAGERGIDIEGLQKTIPATRARVAKWLYQLYNIKNNF